LTCAPGLVLNPGGDWAVTVTLRDETGAAIDATGYTASIVDVTGDLGSALTASLVDPAAGQVRLQAIWQAGWGTAQRRLGTARLSLVNGPAEHVSAPFAVDVAGVARRLVIPRGSDQTFRFTWPDDRDGADLSGETVDVIHASATLAPLVSVAVIDAATRLVEVHVEGDLATPLGPAGTFQLRRRTGSTNPRALAPLSVSFR
jgi:hypothetical protein